MNSSQQAEYVMRILEEHPESPLRQLRELAINSDADYLELWFRAAEYAHSDADWVAQVMKQDVSAESFEFHLSLRGMVRERCQAILSERLDNVPFVPRIEDYLNSYSWEDRSGTRQILLGYLYHIYKGESKGVCLSDIAKAFEIPRSLVLSMTDTHPFFVDGIFEFEESRYNKDWPFHYRDLWLTTATYSIFANIDMPEEELALASRRPIARRYLVLDGIDEANTENSVRGDQDADEEPHDGEVLSEVDGSVSSSLEDILRELDHRESPNAAATTATQPESCQQASASEESLGAYEDDLDYFYAEFRWINVLSQVRKMEQDDSVIIDQHEHERSIAQLRREYRKQREICDIRLRKSIANGFIPRLELLADRVKLSELEKSVLKALVSARMFSDESERGVEIRAILGMLASDPRERIREKRIFRRTAPLARTGLVHVEDREDLQKQLFDCRVVIDSRLIEYLIGEDYDVSDYVEGSQLYRPSTRLQHVVLPESTKQQVLRTIDGFPEFLKAKEKLQFSDVVEYGNALVMLFVGPSGTGKTMLANAVGQYLDKKVLLFEHRDMQQFFGFQATKAFSLVFREARMNDAVLFFDESEDLLNTRISDMLMEIEKHEGIVIFATNASFRIDEAMRRRINLIVNFQEPGPALRRKIWEIHLPSASLCPHGIDLDGLARTYELNGGLIKNAVFSALGAAVHRNGQQPPQITTEDLRAGAAEQLHNKLFMSNLHRARVPERGLDNVVLPEDTMRSLHEVVELSKARRVLETEWGFDDMFPDHNGVSVLFHGPPGTGKTHTAEALAFEMGKTLKVVNYAQVLSMWVGGTEKALESLFNEVADSDSVLLFDEADALFAARGATGSALDRYANVETDVLLQLIEQHNGFAILTTNKLENMDPAFFRRLHYIIEFDEPNRALRLQLWRTLMPEKMPLGKDVDHDWLAGRFQFTGAEIKATIVQAATRCARLLEGERLVGMQALIDAAQRVEKTRSYSETRPIGFRSYG